MTACVVGALGQASAALGPCHGPGWAWYQKSQGFPGTPSFGGHLTAFAVAFFVAPAHDFIQYCAAARAVHSRQVAVSRHFRGMPLYMYTQGTARALRSVHTPRCTGISTLCPLSCRDARIISPIFTTRLPMHTGSVAHSGGDHTCAPQAPTPRPPSTGGPACCRHAAAAAALRLAPAAWLRAGAAIGFILPLFQCLPADRSPPHRPPPLPRPAVGDQHTNRARLLQPARAQWSAFPRARPQWSQLKQCLSVAP